MAEKKSSDPSPIPRVVLDRSEIANALTHVGQARAVIALAGGCDPEALDQDTLANAMHIAERELKSAEHILGSTRALRGMPRP